MNSSGPTGRLFIAVPLPKRMAESLHLLAVKLEEKLPGRYVSIGNYHVTLAFIGEAPLALSSEIEPLLRKIGHTHHQIPVGFSKLGHFGRRDNAILWAGLENSERILPMADALRSGLDKLGVSYDRKPVRPHITVARKVDLEGVQLPNLPAENGKLDSIILYLSTRRGGQLVYEPLTQAFLA